MSLKKYIFSFKKYFFFILKHNEKYNREGKLNCLIAYINVKT